MDTASSQELSSHPSLEQVGMEGGSGDIGASELYGASVSNGDVKLRSASDTTSGSQTLEVVHMRSRSDPVQRNEERRTEQVVVHFEEGQVESVLRRTSGEHRPRSGLREQVIRQHRGGSSSSDATSGRGESLLVRDERSSSNDSSRTTPTTTSSKGRCESFETSTSGISSYESGPHANLEHSQLTPIPSASSMNTDAGRNSQSLHQAGSDLDIHKPLVHPSDIFRKLANLRRIPNLKRRYSNPVLGHISPHNALERVQALNADNKIVVTSPRDIAGYARLRQLKQDRAQSADIEGEGEMSIIWEDPRSYMAKTRSLDFAHTQLQNAPFSSKAR